MSGEVQLIKEIKIEENEIGHGYESMLGGCFDETVTSIYIAEPWLLNSFQFDNFLQFTALVIKKSPNLKTFSVKTNPHAERLEIEVNQTEHQSNKKGQGCIRRRQNDVKRATEIRKLKRNLRKLKQNFFQRKLLFNWQFDTDLHDRRIEVTCKDDECLILMGRGLDIYNKPEGKYSPGYFDLELRKCMKTSVQIFVGSDVFKNN